MITCWISMVMGNSQNIRSQKRYGLIRKVNITSIQYIYNKYIPYVDKVLSTIMPWEEDIIHMP
jgi:hypothetical protein